jgi:hypothetical protein
MSNTSNGRKGFYIELDPELVRLVKELASSNDRAFRDEVSHALRRHLASPPRVVVNTPELGGAWVVKQEEVPPPVKRPRGRPRKNI